MQQYELLYILPAKLEEATRKQAVERVNQTITGKDGIIKDHNMWLTRKLSYPINHIRQGIFMLAHFTTIDDNAFKIRRELELDEHILRVSVIQVSEKTKTTPKRQPAKILPQSVRTKIEETPAAAPVAVIEENQEKISLEELDKKLEELLSDKSEIK